MKLIELFYHLPYLNTWNYLTVSKKWLISNRIISVKLLYLKSFNSIQIELFVLDSNSWNNITQCQQMS